MNSRRPAVAGQFYPDRPDALKSMVDGFMPESKKEKATAIIAPHAGYIYSGGVAGAVYSAIIVPDDVLLIGPNHTGMGKKASVMAKGRWEVPLGAIEINEELALSVVSSSRLFSEDSLAHLAEHSLEVQLPFIMSANKNARIVPITVMHFNYRDCRELGEGIAKAVKEFKKDVLIAVSSDMTHYEPDKKTREKDRFAIDAILGLDAKGLLDVAGEKDITMCGVIPAAIAIVAAKSLGAKDAYLVKYATSGEVSGDYDQVVGYAGIVIK